ncbi:MAG: TolC family protein [Gammaproteobacteria bacterium]|nr:TolC family protein [Gammaproteobacteria bacterium]
MNSSHLMPGLFILTLSVAYPTLHAEPSAPTLPAVIQAGVSRNPDMPLTEAIRGQGQAIRTQASALFADDPALILRHETDAMNNDVGYRQWESGLAMPLWLPGQRDRRVKLADATDREADAFQQLYIWQVAGQLRELLWATQLAETELTLARHALQSAQALEANVARRVRAGELARTDLILARKETLAREIELATAVSARDAKLMHYQHLTGLDVLPLDIREAAAEGMETPENHPALSAVQVTLARADADRAQIRGERRANPVLMVGGKADRPGSGLSYDSSVFVEISLPLGTKGQATVRNAAAERSYAEAMTAYNRTQMELEHDLHAAIAEQQLAAHSLQLAEQQNLLATESLQLMQRAFELGESDLFTLLQTRAQALTAERDLNLRRLEQGRAVARVNQALGVIPE